MSTKRLMTGSTGAAVLALSLLTGTAACGEDTPTAAPPPPSRNAGKAAAPGPRGPAQGKGGNRIGYDKIPDEYRRSFSERDFVPDPTGDDKRDPFRSWVLRPSLDTGDGPIDRTDVCTEPNVRWGAQDYSVRDLRLVGIVKRGRSYAQFIDKSDKDSWIIRRGDCVGQEKAIVDEIGVGYVSLSITPDAPPGAPAPAPQRQDIPLYPEELEIPEAVVGGEEQ